MKHATASPENPGSSIEFERFHYIHTGRLDEWGEPEVMDLSHRGQAQIPALKEGRIVEGDTLLGAYPVNEGNYLILQNDEGIFAVATELSLPKQRLRRYQVRAVALDLPGRPLAWEVYHQNTLGSWTPLPGQHLRPRSAPAEEWIAKLRGSLSRLQREESRFMEEHQNQTQTAPTTVDASIAARTINSEQPHPSSGNHAQEQSRGNKETTGHRLTAIRNQLGQAADLMTHLERQRGTVVTLQESTIEGRNAERIPTLVPKTRPSQHYSLAPRVRAAF